MRRRRAPKLLKGHERVCGVRRHKTVTSLFGRRAGAPSPARASARASVGVGMSKEGARVGEVEGRQ